MSLFHVFSNHICILYIYTIYMYLYISIKICLHIYTHVHTLVLNLSEPVILSFLCCILQAESQSKPESESPAPLRRGPAAPLAPFDGNDSWKNTKRTWKIRRLNFSTLSLKHMLFPILEGFPFFLAKNLWVDISC